MRLRVEAVGPAWVCHADGPWSSNGGDEFGTERVGRRVVVWQRLLLDDRVAVAHPGAISFFAAWSGVKPQTEGYFVRLLEVGSWVGTRITWACPGCGRSCQRLYLTPMRSRLGSRALS
jgi:hypothetical protein